MFGLLGRLPLWAFFLVWAVCFVAVLWGVHAGSEALIAKFGTDGARLFGAGLLLGWVFSDSPSPTKTCKCRE